MLIFQNLIFLLRNCKRHFSRRSRVTSFYSNMELIGNIKTYDWGKLGNDSKVAQLACLNDPNFELDEKISYAELWMGSHVSGPSSVKGFEISLLDAFESDPNLIGGLSSLPFLFKVLSIRKALSIQVHPNLAQAKHLHAEFPHIYKDPNHKPEMAIAITPFLALCGFRPIDEIHETLSQLPEFVELLGPECIDAVKTNTATGLKECFAKLMNSSESSVSMCIENITKRFEEQRRIDDIGLIFIRLQREFPNDVGNLCLFFLNIIKLKPGEAIFLGAGEIHAYLDGDCIECMACSDNVIRAGLTPKLIDVPRLLELLTYNSAPKSSKLFQPFLHPKLKYTKIFSPPIPDCAVADIRVPPSEIAYKIENRTCGSILLVLSGSGCIRIREKQVNLSPGAILFLPAVPDGQVTEYFDLELTSQDGFIAYQAMHNDF